MRLLRRTRRKLWRWLFVSGVATLLLTVGPVACVRWADPPTTAFMLGHRLDEALAGRWARVDQRWVELDQISPQLRLAVVASEDQKFPHHQGFDLEQIFDALADHQRGKRLRGASTISQQTAKNLWLWQGRSMIRKGLEAYLTSLVELMWGKRRILEVYLNVAEFGRGIYGAEAAARHYFGRSAARLSREQAALLAATLPNPTRRNPARPSAYLRDRARLIQTHMRRLGLAHVRL